MQPKDTAISVSSTTVHVAAAPRKFVQPTAQVQNSSTLPVAWGALTVTATAVYLELVCVQVVPSEFVPQRLLATNTQTLSVQMVATTATATNVLPIQNVAAETLRRNV